MHSYPIQLARGFSASARVVLAEDDAEMRRLLAESLTDDGYDVVEAGSGLLLFGELRRLRWLDDQPAVIVSDIRMPGLTGLEVLETIRRWGWTVPVILVTAFGDDETLEQAMRLGATAVFNKPFDVDDLRTAVLHYAPLKPSSH